MTMNTIRFNTGRKYTAAGQRIVATYRPHNEAEDQGGTVTFFDHDRQVDGEFDIMSEMLFTQTVIMGAYDTYRAKGTRRSWADGLQRGGCNTDLGELA
jgi:hypothetical protein